MPKARKKPVQHDASKSAPLVVDGRFQSASLGREMPYRIYLPNGYMSTTRRYPVFYLLHGAYGSYENWDTLTNLSSYVVGFDWIIVMPEGDDSWYTNSASNGRDRFEDYIGQDLITEIDGKYRTIRDRHTRAIAGLSMGGYGALKLAMRNPQAYFFAGSISGAMDAARDLDTRLPEYAAKLQEIFGPPSAPARPHNDIFALLQNVLPADLPYLYLACGTEDRFLSVNHEFSSELSRLHVHYEYHETPGNHDWSYWDQQIRSLLNVLVCRASAKACHSGKT